MDDDPLFIRIFERMMRETASTLGFHYDLQTFVHVPKDIYDLKTDLFFLDVEMPQNGFDVSRQMNPDTNVIFVTAHTEFITDSFRYHPYSFIHKSLLEKDLKKVLERYLEETKEYIDIRLHWQELHLRVDDIRYIEVQRNTLTVHHNRCDYTAKMSLRTFMRMCTNTCFIQVNSAMVVNIRNVLDFNHSTITLKRGNPIGGIQVTKKYMPGFIEKYYTYNNEV